jgi:hypothetical protein
MTNSVKRNMMSASDRPGALADAGHRQGEQHREDDDLQDVALGHRLDDRRRREVRDDVAELLRLRGRIGRGESLAHGVGGRSGLRSGGGGVASLRRGGGLDGERLGAVGERRLVIRPMRAGQRNAHARLGEIHRAEADEERERGDDLEVDQRLHADAADLADVAGAGDADHQRGEDQRRDDRLDQVEEERRQRPHGQAPLRHEVAEQDADDETDEDLRRERNFHVWRDCTAALSS